MRQLLSILLVGCGTNGAMIPPQDANVQRADVVRPPPTACNDLGPVGEWQDITPPQQTPIADYRPAAFVVDPVNSGTVYLGTDSFDDGHSKGIFKTTDCGASWVHINTGTRGMDIDAGRNWTFAINPDHPNILYTTSGYAINGIYRSVNSGVDWQMVWPINGDPHMTPGPDFIKGIVMDPDDPNHLLISFHSACNMAGEGCIAESEDAGDTWRVIYGTPPFEEQVPVYFLGSRDHWFVPSRGHGFRTTDSGATWTDIGEVAGGLGGHSAGPGFRAPDGTLYIGGVYGLDRSTDDGLTWTNVPGTGTWVDGMTTDGTLLYIGTQSQFYTSPVDDGLTWTPMVPPVIASGHEGCGTQYDPGHHLLYATCGPYGFWRMRIE